MNDLNECYLIGRAVDDVKVFDYEGRVKYSFIVAINYFSSKKQQEFSDFIPISFWRNKPNKDVDLLKKGDNVAVNGRISINSYEKDDIKRVAIELVANYVKVFKPTKEANNIDDLLSLLKSNSTLLDAIIKSSDIQLSDHLVNELTS